MRIFVFMFIIGLSSISQAQIQTNTALVKLTLTDFKKKILQGETILFVNQKDKKKYSVITDAKGYAEIPLIKGFTYDIKFKGLNGDEFDYSPLELENKASLTGFTLQLQYEPGKSFTLKNVLFDFGKATLKPTSFPALDDLVEMLKRKPAAIIEIGGHTDNIGKPEDNLKLSEARAKAVMDYVIKKGITNNRLSFKGYGDTQPVKSNDTDEGRQENRRTEAKILKQ